jgi:hypothetical protein
MIADVIAFLAARCDECDAAAKRAGGYRWESDDEALKADHGPHGVEQIGEFWKIPDDPANGYVSDPASAAHAALHDPARALREVEADRRLLGLYERAKQYRDRVFAQPEPRSISDEMRAVTQMLAVEQVLRFRTAIYSDHPDYRQES